ncbi:ABC transporter permease subunit [Nocardia sp. SYP-A9097]|uniref:ABC transporter permease n=1 Tax=Nocardia sp. SYP-A9097 TaxID=2663237 RepID=UPI00129B7311|nr:ABC transporter permease [Nocardia sp. SYP-A9097]MRH87942.1 ABC transporter permease subunit [Nocardia sp. SYP-A9097]
MIVAKRIAGLVATLFAASFAVFASLYLAPGDPVTFLMHGHPATPEAVASIRAQYHLDDPFIVRYFDWIGGVCRGDFGRSVQFRQDVSDLLTSRMATTAWLVGYATLLIVLVGLVFGALAALRPGAVDRAVMTITAIATATPAFVAAVILVSVFSVQLGWLPAFGDGSGAGLGGRISHLTLPAIALAFTFVGLLARVTRASMLAELGREHVEVARSRGVPEASVIRKHVLRNALGPITTVTGTVVAGLLVSTSIVETAFGVSGIGQLLVSSVAVKDFPVVQAVCLLVVAAFVIVNLLVDVLLPIIDPRLARVKVGAA